MGIEALQAECDTAMGLIFEHFHKSTPVTFYKNAAQEVVVEDPSWNSDFDNPYATNIINTAQKKEILCRVWYMNDGGLIRSVESGDNATIKLSSPVGRIKIQVPAADFSWLKEAVSFYVFGEKFTKDSDWRGVGMLQTFTHYELILIKGQ